MLKKLQSGSLYSQPVNKVEAHILEGERVSLREVKISNPGTDGSPAFRLKITTGFLKHFDSKERDWKKRRGGQA